MIVLLSMDVAVGIVQHGEPKEGKYNAGVALVSTGILVGMLIWGGFFK
jgi:hypothetical protein